MFNLKQFPLILLIILAFNSYAAAGWLPTILGVDASVSYAAKRMEKLIDRSRDAAFALEYQTNKDTADRIKQIDDCVQNALREVNKLENKTVNDIDRVLDKYSNKIELIEKDIFSRLMAAIDQTECSVDRTLNKSLQDAFGAFGRWVNTNSFEIRPPLISPDEKKCDRAKLSCNIPKKMFKINASDFSETYLQVREYLLNRLRLTRDDTPLASILRSYGIIADFAKRTGCLTGQKDAYAEEASIYMSKIVVWQQTTGEKRVIVP